MDLIVPLIHKCSLFLNILGLLKHGYFLVDFQFIFFKNIYFFVIVGDSCRHMVVDGAIGFLFILVYFSI